MADQLVGRSLGRYQITKLLGEGGMGAVYKAHDITLQRDVAIKVMHAQYARQPNFQERFLQEARVAARLDHPGIVKVFDFGQAEGLHYIVMEFVTGDNLAQMLRDLHAARQWIVLPEALALVRQVALALDYAHRHGVLHRDIKPANIMIKAIVAGELPYQPILTDLGLARLGDGAGLTQTGSSMGTPAYMSPEQALGEETDARSDVYSLGVLLYELALGHQPFEANTLSEAIRYHTREEPPPPQSIRPDIPEALAHLLLRALAKEPSQRFDSAGALAAALANLPANTLIATVPPAAVGGATSLLTQHQQSLLELRGASIVPEFSAGARRLQILAPDGRVRTVEVTQSVLTVGRGSENDIALADERASRRHARIEFDGTQYRVTDLGSTNGTYLEQTKLLAGVPQVWTPDQPLRIGDHHLRWLPVAAEPSFRSRADTLAASGSTPAGAAVERIGLSARADEWTATPGTSLSLPIVLSNQSNTMDHFTVAVEGPLARWVQVPPPVQLFPGAQQEVTLAVQPPRSPQLRAGRHPLVIRVESRAAPDETASKRFTVEVAPYVQFRSELHPEEAATGTPLELVVENQGNAPQTFNLVWRDRADELMFDPPRAQLHVPPGEVQAAEFYAYPQPTRWIGGAKTHAIAAQVATQGSQVQTHNGTITSRGRIPVWVPSLLLLIFLALVGLAGNALRQRNALGVAAQQTETAVQQAAISTQTAAAVALQDEAQAATATAIWLEEDDDRDGLSNRQELELQTLPGTRDTDGDSIDDGEEVNKWRTNPLVADSDGDGLRDGDEISRGLNPNNADTDGDGEPDARDPDPGRLPTPTPNTAATAAFVATQTAVAQVALQATATMQALQAQQTAQAIAQQTAQAVAQQTIQAATATAAAQLTAQAGEAAAATATAQAVLAQTATAEAATATAQAAGNGATATAQAILAQIATAEAATATAQAAGNGATATALAATAAAESAATATAAAILTLTAEAPTPIACYPDLPSPQLATLGTENYEANGQQWTRYDLRIENREEFPDALFAAAPELPPCEANPNASRTWVDIFDSSSNLMDRYCVFASADDLQSFSFATAQGDAPPAAVFVTLTDRQCGITYTSNSISFE